MTNKPFPCPESRISLESAPEAWRNAGPEDALYDAENLTALLQRFSELQAQDGNGMTKQEIAGQQLVFSLLADKLAVASGLLFVPFVSLANDAPSFAEVMQTGAQVLEHRKALTDAVDRVEGLAGLLEDMADDARMFVRQDEDLLADALRTRAKALREAVSSLRAALPQVEQPAGAEKKV